MTNTERLIASVEHATREGRASVTFFVGKYTGNNPSVVAALRRRGYRVERAGKQALYKLFSKAQGASK